MYVVFSTGNGGAVRAYKRSTPSILDTVRPVSERNAVSARGVPSRANASISRQVTGCAEELKTRHNIGQRGIQAYFLDTFRGNLSQFRGDMRRLTA